MCLILVNIEDKGKIVGIMFDLLVAFGQLLSHSKKKKYCVQKHLRVSAEIIIATTCRIPKKQLIDQFIEKHILLIKFIRMIIVLFI